MADMTNPHDKFFKGVFSQLEIVRDFLKHYLSDNILKILDLDRIEIQKDSFIDSEFQEHFSDLLFVVPRKDEGEIYIYTLFEHKSSADPFVTLQLLRYMVRIWDRDVKNSKKAPLRWIIPIVIYHGASEWSISTEFAGLFSEDEILRPFLPNFHYLLHDLPRYNDDEILGDNQLRAVLLLMKYIFNKDFLIKIKEALSLLDKLKPDVFAENFKQTVVLYIVSAVDKVNYKDLEKVMSDQAFLKGGKNIMQTIAEYLKQEGIQLKSKEDIRKILEIRFGVIPSEVNLFLEKTNDLQQLDQMLVNAVRVPSLSDFKHLSCIL